MTVFLRGLLFAASLTAVSPAVAADLQESGPVRFGRFRATCEDLGQVCFAEACGRNQIEAALNCRRACLSSVILSVVPGSCPLPARDGRVRLRAKG